MRFKDKNGKEHEAFKEFHLSNNVVIGVFQGSKGSNPDLDILIKYQEPGKRVRTPKHIHWAIDLLIKKEHNKGLTSDFVKFLVGMWDQIEPFQNKYEQQKCELKFATSSNLSQFGPLSQYGEYSVEFIVHIIELMMIMEKTGLDRAFMFKGVLDAILEDKDIFTVVSKATQTRCK